MMPHLRTLMINSGQSVSDVLPLKNFTTVAALVAPIVTSCQIFIQAATTSGGVFTRLVNAAGSGDLTWAVAAGSKCWAPNDLRSFPFARIETSVAMTSPASFTVLLRI
jgi:hypothetical protein